MTEQATRRPHTAITRTGSLPIAPGRTIAVINQKGGQGKTTTTAEIATHLAQQGKRVRAMDADGQDGALSVPLAPQWHHTPPAERWELADVLLGKCTLDQATWPTIVPGLDIVPSSEAVKQFGRVASDPGREWTLHEAIEASDRDYYDADLIDCPPDLDEMTLAALVAADGLIIPVKVGGLDFKGVAQLNRTLAKVRKRLRPDQVTHAIVVTQRQPNALTDQVIDQLLEDFPDAYHAAVRATIRVGEAGFAEQPVLLYAPECTAAADYREITRVVFAPVLEGAAA
ncbi:ParA family protein [Nocardiopsis sp. FIRDI 009]|uniref:ParA family protein n=1 Tax=Nocardiopsis sp. FIRDI 009 TaxID=714197 RepID=UPI001300961B|nr:ParA family protein [Nocardiopsis sp. FIRDI 009]